MIPNRTYTFYLITGGIAGITRFFGAGWSDTWYNRFEDNYWTSSSSGVLASVDIDTDWYGCGIISSGTLEEPGDIKVTTTTTLDALSVAAGGPAILALTPFITTTETTEEVTKDAHGLLHLEANQTVEHSSDARPRDVVRGVEIPHAYVDTLGGTALPAMTPVTLGPQQPVTLVFPGDFRRPPWARATGVLTDDELFAVKVLAQQLGMGGGQLLAILLELTGARRDAYHPDGFYGISNLTAAQIAAASTTGVATARQFLASSVAVQLTVTTNYFHTLKNVSTVIPVFLTLATGQPWPGATPTTVVPAPLPPRLQPLSTNGTTVTGADVAARISARAALVLDEFNARVPGLVSWVPPPSDS